MLNMLKSLATNPYYRYSKIIIIHLKAFQFASLHSRSSFENIQESIKAAISTKTYQHIPNILNSLKEPYHLNPNPFSCLSLFPENERTQIIDQMLQSFIPLRPHFRQKNAYECLLSYALQCPCPFPLGLVILQRTLRSGCIPVPQTHLLISTAWFDRRSQSESVSDILLEMKSIGYYPDTGTCNYIISSLCAVDEITEAVKVLKGMSKARCAADLESYGTIISSMCAIRNTNAAVEMMKEMVMKVGLTPRHGTVKNVAAALRANKEIWKAVDMIEVLEKEDVHVSFETYELVVDGCLECHEFVLAAKVVMKMTGKGFIPHIRVRQKVVEGLVGADEYELACVVRQRFSELKS